MKKFLFFSILFCFCSAFINAQTDSTKHSSHTKVGGISLNLGGGTNIFQGGGFDILNKHLADKGYAIVGSQYPNWNLDIMHLMYKNTVFNFNLNGIIKKNTVNDSAKTTYSSTTFNVAIGRVILHSSKFLFYPMIGADFGNANIHSHYSGLHIANDISGTNKYRGLNVSLNLDYLFRGMGKKIDWKSSQLNIVGTAVLSLSVGYVYCPSDTYWNDSNFDGTIKNTQNVNYPVNVLGALTYSNFSMFYASLKIGFGSFVKR